NLFVNGVKVDNTYGSSVLPSYFNCDIHNVSDAEFEKILGREIPNPHYEFYKKNRIEVDVYTTVSQLKYARGWAGRLFGGAINFAIKLLRAIGQKSTANTLIMGVYYNPLRAL